MVRVIIVEDEDIERKALSKLLMDMYPSFVKIVREFDDGSTAISDYEDSYPDLVFMDIRMHDMDGLTAAKIMKQKHPNIRIIIVTAYSEFEYAKRAIKIGVEDFLIKPYSKKTLKELMDQQIYEIEKFSVEELSVDDNGLVEKALCYISDHYMEELKLEDISMSVGLSKYYFTRLFKKVTGKTCIDYLNSYRVEKAKKLFDNTDKTVKEVSYEVGIFEPNYFSKIFRKYTGYSPKEYNA